MAGSTAAVSSVAAAPSDSDIARKLQAVEQLTSIFGFDNDVASTAVDAVIDMEEKRENDVSAPPIDVTACYNFILDQGLATDKGGPITPIDNCPHVKDNVTIGVLQQLSIRNPISDVATIQCSHTDDHDDNNDDTAGLKSTHEPCKAKEQWLCLQCGVSRCSRYSAGHALVHFKASGHCVHASWTDLSVWCHLCNKYLSTNTGATGNVLQPIAAELERLKFSNSQPTERTLAAGVDELPASKKQRSDDGNDYSAEDEDRKPASSETKDEDFSANNDEENFEAESDTELLDLIAAAAQSHGIPIELLLRQSANYGDEDDEPVDYPFGTLPRNLKEVADFIVSDQCKSIVVLAGAGMSVTAGIPDFRSADGLYATLNPDLLTASTVQKQAIRMDPTVALEQNMFLDNPLPCLELQREFILGTRAQRWKATLAHRFIELLHTKTGKLVRNYTQNIDGLEDQCTDLPQDKVIAVHGSMDRAECARCGEPSNFGDFCDQVQSKIKDLSMKDESAPNNSTPIECKVCGYATMKPAIVLFRSSLPKIFFESMPTDVKEVDLLIVMGTSLRVAPANSLVWRVPNSAMRLLVNREKAGDHLGMQFDEELTTRDYFAQGDCDATLLELMDHLGWTEDLKPLLAENALPASCDKLLREHIEKSEAC